MRITQGEIAERVGVSQVTVSKVLNKSRSARISPDKRSEIVALSKLLGYQPRNHTTHNIGYVLQVNALGIESEVQTLKAIQEALSSEGYRVVLAEFDKQDPALFHQNINVKTVDGVIFSHWHEGKICEHLHDEMPFIVAADFYGKGANVDQVRMDIHQSVRLLTEHLMEHGHQRICFVTGLVDISILRRAKEGFFEAFQAAGISLSQASLIETSEAKDISPLLDKELRRKKPPTAIIGFEFVRTTNIVNDLQSKGYRIPHDISVASVFDSPHYQWLRPFVTSTTASGRQVGMRATQRLLEKIETFDTSHQEIVIASELIERDSVCKAKTT